MATEGVGAAGVNEMAGPSYMQQAVNMRPEDLKPAAPKATGKLKADALKARKAAIALAAKQRGAKVKALKDRAKPLGGDHYGGAL